MKDSMKITIGDKFECGLYGVVTVAKTHTSTLFTVTTEINSLRVMASTKVQPPTDLYGRIGDAEAFLLLSHKNFTSTALRRIS